MAPTDHHGHHQPPPAQPGPAASADTALPRRGFLGGASAVAAAATTARFLQIPRAEAAAATAEQPAGENLVSVGMRVNGEKTRLNVDPRSTLLDTLRERLGLTGTKKGCDRGQCGSCTVHADGRRVLACLTLTASADGREVTTIEGLAGGDGLHPMQRAFIDRDGLQCGFCTPGQIMSAVALVGEGDARSDAEVREQMSGNICRCSAYPFIVAAVQDAREAMS